VPQTLYAPIKQQAVLIKDTAVGREFVTFFKTAEVRSILENFGYKLP